METVAIVRAVARHICGSGGRETAYSSRVRLARNIRDMTFPNRSDAAAQTRVLSIIDRAAAAFGDSAPYEIVPIADLSRLEQEALVECHLLSRELLLSERRSALVVSPTAAAGILVNEEDHFRIQAVCGGQRLKRALALAQKLERALAAHTDFAYMEGIGYLTSCPTNVGTGLRASVMLQLPALFFARKLEACLQKRIGPNMAVRGIYGEGSDPIACFLQVSNQATAGLTQDEILDKVTRTAQAISRDEIRARTGIMERFAWDVEDLVCRAAATLMAARSIGSGEAMDRLSQVRLGVALGVLAGVDVRVIDQLIIFIRPASLQILLGEALPPRERDVRRAKLIREHLNGLTEVA